MPPKKHTASSPVSAPETPRKRGIPPKQNGTTPKTGLLAGTAAARRKASAALDDDPNLSQKKRKTSEDPKPKAQAEFASDVPYAIEMPAMKARKNETPDDVYRSSDGASLGLEIDYAIRPGSWGKMKSYRTVKYCGLDFAPGDFAYFANTLEPPEQYTEEEILASNDPLKYERKNYYLGMIADARASDPQEVYLRILYVYWPEELLQGRQPYHGVKEVILSNHMDIMDAHCISGKVDVEHLQESVEHVDGIYWRQTLDVGKKHGKHEQPGALSKLPEYCRCRQPMNPDRTVFICRKCKKWNHEECLIEATLERAWEKHEDGTLGEGDDEDTVGEPEEGDSIEVSSDSKKKSPVMAMVTAVASVFKGSPAPNGVSAKTDPKHDAPKLEEAQIDGLADSKRKGRPAKVRGKKAAQAVDGLIPWEGKFSATIDTTGKFGTAGVAMAQVVDEETSEAVWTTAVSCFGCKARLD